MIHTISDTILEQMAEEHRVVLSSWRAAVYVRRATRQFPEEQRRWSHIPSDASDVQAALAQMRARNTIQAISGHSGLNRVSAPFTRHLGLDERELLFEIHPYATISHGSALQYHSLSFEFTKHMTISVPSDGFGGVLPIGTQPEDWDQAILPSGSTPGIIRQTPVIARSFNPNRYFGHVEVESSGVPLRYTSVERSLIDAIMSPRLCGGIDTVLNAWYEATDRVDVPALIQMVERFDIGILRQRVGYILESLGLTHPHLDRWQRTSQRGGSSRLVAYLPYAPVYSERWNLSLNAQVGALVNQWQ